MDWKDFLKPTGAKIALLMIFLAISGPFVYYYLQDGQSCYRNSCEPLTFDKLLTIETIYDGIALPLSGPWMIISAISNGDFSAFEERVLISLFTFLPTCYLLACFLARQWNPAKPKVSTVSIFALPIIPAAILFFWFFLFSRLFLFIDVTFTIFILTVIPIFALSLSISYLLACIISSKSYSSTKKKRKK